jgi:nucleoside transporter
LALAYALVYSPTLALSNSITFRHVPDGTRDFPSIRVLGTIGWIVAGLVVAYVLPIFFPLPKDSTIDMTHFPLLLAAAGSAVLGLYSFFLPYTPPKGKAGDPMPALKALGLLRNFSFAVFFGVSFIITIVLAFYYGFTGNYLSGSVFPRLPENVRPTSVAGIMTIGQISEMIILPFLPFFLYRFGMKWVLAIGMLAWGIRYLLFALGYTGQVSPYVVIASLAFHGVCFDFFFAAGFIHVDNEAPPEIRASGQALFTFLTYGVGMWLGNMASGYVVNHYTLWNRAGGEAVFTKVADDYFKAVKAKGNPRDLVVELSQLTGGKLKFDDADQKLALAALGKTQKKFDKNFAAFESALRNNMANPRDADLTAEVVKAARSKLRWQKKVDQLKHVGVPKEDWPAAPEAGPDIRDWYSIWIIPSIGVLISLVIFVLFFHLRPRATTAS